MYSAVLMIHSLVRWLVLVAVAARTGRALIGLGQALPYGDTDRRLSLLAVIVTDLQVTLGLVLYVLSPVIRAAWADPGASMSDGAIRMLMVEHPVTMLAGAALVHVAHAMGKRGTDDRRRHVIASICTLLGLVLILSRIPW